MMNCPFCRTAIPDDSHYCDTCGKELMFCPECGKPRRGTMCAACGADLVKADAFFEASSACGLSLCGEGLNLPLAEGEFGRSLGIWPQLGSFKYVSGRHGRIARCRDEWTLTDLGSTNGTVVNGMKLDKGVPHPVKRGDTVEIATYKFTVK